MSTHTLRSREGLTLTLDSLGATWQRLDVPMQGGSARNVILAGRAGDAAAQSAYFGATIGRCANRIGGARLSRDGGSHTLTPNPGSRHQLHGGPGGFHAREWSVEPIGNDTLRCRLDSPDGDQGYPGALHVTVDYRLLPGLVVEMVAWARSSAATPVCITNHAYFNLDGRPSDVREHRLRIDASRYLPVDDELIPLGPLEPVDGTGFDFRRPKTLKQDWLRDAQQRHGGGYDHAFLFDTPGPAQARTELRSADGALALRIATTLPSIQLYAGQYLGGLPAADGTPHATFAGLALEPQFLPDSPNHPEWPQPSCWLRPGEEYRHVIRYQFVVT